jgi:hypothetical protein
MAVETARRLGLHDRPGNFGSRGKNHSAIYSHRQQPRYEEALPDDLGSKFRRKNATFAGLSAKRRMK